MLSYGSEGPYFRNSGPYYQRDSMHDALYHFTIYASRSGDRPQVVPQGSTNFAFLGQFAEVPDDCVFTVEYSVRSAMIAVYKLLDLEKEVIPVHPSKYDVRVLLTAVRTCLGNKALPLDQMLGQLLSGTVIFKLL